MVWTITISPAWAEDGKTRLQVQQDSLFEDPKQVDLFPLEFPGHSAPLFSADEKVC